MPRQGSSQQLITSHRHPSAAHHLHRVVLPEATTYLNIVISAYFIIEKQ